MDDLVNHRSNESAVKFANRFVTIRGRQHMRKTTVGWSLCVLWKNGETSWVSLAELKESNPLEVAEYAVSQGIRPVLRAASVSRFAVIFPLIN
jgi:hypothetical protein